MPRYRSYFFIYVMFCFVLTPPPLMLCVCVQTFEAALFWKKKTFEAALFLEEECLLNQNFKDRR